MADATQAAPAPTGAATPPDTAPAAIPAPADPAPTNPAPASDGATLDAARPEDAAPASADAAPAGDEIVVSARQSSPADPLERLNAQSYAAIQAVDNAVVGPLAHGYEKGVPGPIRSGLRNFLRNLEEPVSFVNYLLQLKPGRAVKSLARFTVNSTIGIAGLVDVAKNKPFHLPYRPNSFANTFACYGIGPGPYFFLPLIGPTTLRDLIGVSMDKAALPLAVGKPLTRPYYTVPAVVLDSLSDRVEMDGQLQRLREESADPYVATRELYLKQRRAEIGAICPKRGDPRPDPSLPARVGKGVN